MMAVTRRTNRAAKFDLELKACTSQLHAWKEDVENKNPC